MGAWAVDPFGNDEACDWVFELEEVEDLSAVEEAIASIISNSCNAVNVSVASVALAAIAVLVRVKERPSEVIPGSDRIDVWINKLECEPDSALFVSALSVIDIILSDSSELRLLWEETGDYAAWLLSVNELRMRLH